MRSAARKTRSKKFDYDTVSANLRMELCEAAERVRGHLRKEEAAKRERLTEAINAGLVLQEVQNKLDYGQFLEWIDAEFNKASRTVERYQRLAIVFGHRIDTVSDLGVGKAHLLARKSTPEAVIRRVLELTDAGNRPSSSEILKLIKAEQERLQEEQLRKESTVEQPADPATGGRENDAGKSVTASGEQTKERLEYHARRLRRHDRYRHLRIGRSVRSLARIDVPRADNLNKVLSRQFQAAIREDIPKALAVLQAWAEVINSSLTGDE